jgi:hypothetical protein
MRKWEWCGGYSAFKCQKVKELTEVSEIAEITKIVEDRKKGMEYMGPFFASLYRDTD